MDSVAELGIEIPDSVRKLLEPYEETFGRETFLMVRKPTPLQIASEIGAHEVAATRDKLLATLLALGPNPHTLEAVLTPLNAAERVLSERGLRYASAHGVRRVTPASPPENKPPES